MSPTKFAINGMFEFETIGFLYIASVATEVDFDRRRHRHLNGDDYHRALSESGLKNADWSVVFSARCPPDSGCAKLVEFFEVSGAGNLDSVEM